MSACLWAQTPIVGEWVTVDDATGEQKSVVRIYQADNGKFYYAKVYLKDGKLILRGSLDKAGLLGRSQTWLPKK